MNYNNLAQKTNWTAGSIDFENVPFFLTSVNIPGIGIEHQEVGGRHSHSGFVTGDKVSFNGLSFEMLIDEDFLIYDELMKMIRKNISTNTGNYAEFEFDFFIEINNNKGNKVLKLDFEGCRIASLGDIQLTTQDSATEYTLALELVYDRYDIELKRKFDFINCEPKEIVPTRFKKTLEDDMCSLDDWVLWGYPTPILTEDEFATNGKGFNTNGGYVEAGAVKNSIPINSQEPFEFTFRVKQPILSSTDNANFYINFGITEGIGIAGETNGRTGSDVLAVTIDGGVDRTIKTKIYDSEKTTEPEKNNGEFHSYTFSYKPLNTGEVVYTISCEGSCELHKIVSAPSNHDELYLFIQGKILDGVHIVDTIEGTYGDVPETELINPV